MKKIMAIPTLTLLVIAGVYLFINYYSFIFARTVHGTIVAVERVTNPTAILGSSIPAEQIFSFAVAIKQKDGEIVTASTEDRQWAVAQKGQCVQAKFFPYPPWDIDKAGTFHGARLEKLYECDSDAAKTGTNN